MAKTLCALTSMLFFKGGTSLEAMVDFTGGCAELFDLNKPPKWVEPWCCDHGDLVDENDCNHGGEVNSGYQRDP